MLAQEWLALAEGYIKSAEQLLQFNQKNTGSFGLAVGLLAWQGAESSLKAVYVGHGAIKRTHKLSTHVRIIAANNLVSSHELGELRLAAKMVTGSAEYNDMRYPEKDFDYWFIMPYIDLVDRVNAAHEILKICRDKISPRMSQRK